MSLRLVTLDLDGTLLPGDTAFGVILRQNGHAALVERIDAACAAGRMADEEAFLQQWEHVRRLTLQECHRALRGGGWLPGIADGVRRLRAEGLRVCLLTDQPSTVTDFLGRWDLADAICSPVVVKDGRPASIEARFDKLANLNGRLAEWGISLPEVCHVGNGPNDLPVFRAVGHSVAVGPFSEAAKSARRHIPRPRDLGEVVDAVLQPWMESSSKSPHTV